MITTKSMLACATLVLALTLFVLLALFAPETADSRRCARPSEAKIASLPREYPRFYRALRKHFGRSWRQAAIVSWGEGSWHWWASNGQYKGTFQMGSWERRTFGHSNTLAGQAAAAARYWRRNGWGPWECQP